MDLENNVAFHGGYLRVQMTAEGKSTDLWQLILQGEVAGYLDTDGKAVALPEVYEMRLMDGVVWPSIADGDADTALAG